MLLHRATRSEYPAPYEARRTASSGQVLIAASFASYQAFASADDPFCVPLINLVHTPSQVCHLHWSPSAPCPPLPIPAKVWRARTDLRGTGYITLVSACELGNVGSGERGREEPREDPVAPTAHEFPRGAYRSSRQLAFLPGSRILRCYASQAYQRASQLKCPSTLGYRWVSNGPRQLASRPLFLLSVVEKTVRNVVVPCGLANGGTSEKGSGPTCFQRDVHVVIVGY